MNIQTYELTGNSADLLITEIMFFVASARAVKSELVRLSIKERLDSECQDKHIEAVNKILRTMKRNGSIQLFIFSRELKNASTEAEYLKNKFPKLSDINLSEDYFIVKL
jgi:hypothetical protein